MTNDTKPSVMLDPGEYSAGTLRDEDMLDMFDTIAGITKCAWCVSELAMAQGYIVSRDGAEWNGSLYLAESQSLSESIGYLFDHVGESHTPEGFWFGASEGDGASFGVWCIEDYCGTGRCGCWQSEML